MKKLLLLLTLIAVSFANAQSVNIPDANFKAYLVGNTAINTNLDTEIQLSEATAFSGTIDCNSLSISDLTGIEVFTALTSLNCEFNLLTAIDVTQNTALTSLICNNNQLTALDVSQNTALTQLNSHINQLTSLDVSNNNALIQLTCSYNQITSLDVSQSPNLNYALVQDNSLECLNIKNGNNTNFTHLFA